MGRAMSREAGFTGNALHAWSAHNHRVGWTQRARPGRTAPRLQWVDSNHGLRDSFLLCTYRPLFPLRRCQSPPLECGLASDHVDQSTAVGQMFWDSHWWVTNTLASTWVLVMLSFGTHASETSLQSMRSLNHVPPAVPANLPADGQHPLPAMWMRHLGYPDSSWRGMTPTPTPT